MKAGKDKFEMPLWEVHHRSGSRQQLKEFNKTLKKLMTKISEVGEGIPEYDFRIEGNKRSRYLTMTYRPAKPLQSVG
ncbi:MAG: hypothetical protein JKY34_08580 [Kordiimonadaceae bacterium]|nr:hypothetical protein [Kordiimonadaceae bacterium]